MSSNTLLLYTAGTPNGKSSEHDKRLKDAYGLNYDFQAISFKKNEQKEPWFLKINPNGRIPALVDRSRDSFAVFESAAILLYLAQHYDKEHKFSYDPAQDPDLYSEQLQWIFFTHGGIGPMQGQANHFFRYAPEKIPYGINRYINETKRLYSVLNDRLAGREYLVGPGKGQYGLADINTFPWVRGWRWSGVDSLEAFPNVEAWLKRIAERPQVKKGLDVPDPQGPPLTKEEEEKKAQEARQWIMSGQK
ncbi:Glutathione S-transferase, carboxy-terminal domain containing protein [Ceratobasidium theobromae]|uniref:Glutathione S-transferase, carboxy-terminal domain containing protein n=1 Tax=Ceratobasidium theobromae TaxID=1582974 RepID=A0A5N5QK42_9AGAM|nr:Glutathione S-transferase, carboxy-terminal domain containing protein [Ceratobasidium theobromae]